MRHHLVVLHDKYLDLVISGKKRVECRLSSLRRPPFESVGPGDLLWLKLPSRPIRAMATVGQCRFHAAPGPALLRWVRRHESLICADEDFYRDAVPWARYASLVWIESVLTIQPMNVIKSDQRAWVTLDRPPRPNMRIGSTRAARVGKHVRHA